MVKKYKSSLQTFLRFTHEHVDSLDVDNYIDIGIFHFNYSTIVDAIISKKYPSDKMQAIINNYLLDSDDEEIKKEFQDMQAYRKWAKEKAKEALEYARENNLLWEPESNNNEKETD